MKFVELIGIFALTATLAGGDSKAPAPFYTAIPAPAAPAKLEPPPAKPADPIEARYTPAYDKCFSTGDAAHSQTLAMVECAGAEIAVQDRALNQAYKASMAKLEAAQRPKLRESSAWIVFKGAKCASENQTGGTIDSIGIGGCVLRATGVRTVELEAMRADASAVARSLDSTAKRAWLSA